MTKKSAPLSQTQLGIYLDCLSMGDAGAYNRHFLFTLDDSIDLNRVAAAIEKAVAAHSSVFVRIAEEDGEPVQKFSAEDYKQTVEKMTEDEWQKKLAEIVNEPLELYGGRLFRFDLVQTEKAKYFLRTTHHIFLTARRIMYFLTTLQKFMKILTLKFCLKVMTHSTRRTTNLKRVKLKNLHRQKIGTKKILAGLTLRRCRFPIKMTKKFPSIHSLKLFRLIIRQ